MQGGFAFADVHGDDSSDSDRQDSFLKNQMGANGISAVDVVYSNQFNKSEFVVLLIYIYAFYIKKRYFSSATVRNQRNIVIVGGSNHEILLS